MRLVKGASSSRSTHWVTFVSKKAGGFRSPESNQVFSCFAVMQTSGTPFPYLRNVSDPSPTPLLLFISQSRTSKAYDFSLTSTLLFPPIRVDPPNHGIYCEQMNSLANKKARWYFKRKLLSQSKWDHWYPQRTQALFWKGRHLVCLAIDS